MMYNPIKAVSPCMLDIYRICGPKCIEFVVQGKPTSACTKK